MREELDFKTALLGLGVVGVIGSIVVVKFVREAKEASACAHRPRQPWDI
jgi:hypothetical protein